MDFYGLTEGGCVRLENQDRILTDGDLGLFVVADGMGGHRHGEMAAELAISTLRYYLESSQGRADVTWPFGFNFNLSIDGNRLVTGVRLANRQVWKRAEEAPEYSGMGTTIAAVVISEGLATAANVGDSRIYLFRRGQLAQISTDDTWLSAVLEKNSIAPAQLSRHPLRNLLTQAAGTEKDIQVHTTEISLVPDDVLLACSDGLHGVVPDEEIRSILDRAVDLEARTKALVEAAKTAGAPDNISCVLVRP